MALHYPRHYLVIFSRVCILEADIYNIGQSLGLLDLKNMWEKLFLGFFFILNNFIYKTITYTTYSINYTYIVLATYTTDTYTYTNYAYTTLRYMYYNTININLIYGWRVYKVLFNFSIF